MPYELQFFENLVMVSMNDHEKRRTTNLEEMNAQLAKEKALFGLRLHKICCEKTSEEEINICIREHQRTIGFLSTCLSTISIEEGNNKDKEQQTLISGYLISLMFFLQQDFPSSFSMQEKITGTMLHTVREELIGQQNAICNDLLKAMVAKSLIDAIKLPLNQLLHDAQKGLTWHYYFYYSALFRELNQLLEQNEEPAACQYAVVRCMLYFNFNSFGMFNYAKQSCRKEMEEKANEEERRRLMDGWLKKLKQCHVMPEIALRQNRDSLAGMLGEWLSKEKEYLFPEEMTEYRQAVVAKEKELVKPRVLLSVPRFAYLIRLLIECSVFQSKHLTEILRVFSGQFATNRSEFISLQSMRTHYYDPDRSTVHAIRDLLYSMLSQSKKEYS